MSHRSCKRPRISLSASSAMRALASSKATARKKSRASSMGMAVSCGRLRPSILTARDSGRRRPPSHRSQCCTPMYCSNSRRCFSLAPRNFSSRNGMTPSYLSLCDQLEPRRLVYVKVTFSSPRPWRNPCFCSATSSPHGVSRSKPRCSAAPSYKCKRQRLLPSSPSGASAPARRVLAGSGTIRRSLISTCVPRPWQAGHMPWGLLKENICGVGSW